MSLPSFINFNHFLFSLWLLHIFPCFMPILFILVCQAHFRLWKAWMILVFKSFIRCCHLFIAKLNRWVSDAWLNFLLENQIWEFESQRKCSIKSWSCEQVRFSWRNVNQLHGESSFNESRFSYIENFGSENKIIQWQQKGNQMWKTSPWAKLMTIFTFLTIFML